MKTKSFLSGCWEIGDYHSYLLAVLILLACIISCGDLSVPSDLDQGRQFIRYLSSKKFLRESSFGMWKNREPSGFVNWVFSDFGKVDWLGITPKDIPDSIPLKQKVDIFAPTQPESVVLVPDERDPEKVSCSPRRLQKKNCDRRRLPEPFQ